MSRNEEKQNNRKNSTGSIIENNKFVLILSFVIAVFCWMIVSMYETPVTERIVQNVKVQISGTDELHEEYGLSVYDTEEYVVDVTVKGPSYIVNSSTFTADNIILTASCDTVVSAGTYPLTINGNVTGLSNGVEISKYSRNTINVYFDKDIEKQFTLTADIKELEGYSLAEGMIRENPVLSKQAVTIAGPSKEVNKITSVKAHIELNSELKATERFDAEIIPDSESATLNSTNLTVKTEGPFYITIPVSHTGKYKTSVKFTNVPKAYEKDPIPFTVTPDEIDVTVATGESASDITSDHVNIGTIDYSKIIGEKVNYFTIENSDLNGEKTKFTVSVDASDYYVLWSTVDVDVSGEKIPDNVTVLTNEINSVRLVGPKSSLLPVDRKIAYAVPVLENISDLSAGKHTVPAKIKFRNLTDSWVYGSYKIEIEIK